MSDEVIAAESETGRPRAPIRVAILVWPVALLGAVGWIGCCLLVALTTVEPTDLAALLALALAALVPAAASLTRGAAIDRRLRLIVAAFGPACLAAGAVLLLVAAAAAIVAPDGPSGPLASAPPRVSPSPGLPAATPPDPRATCPTTLSDLVAAAPPGGTVAVPACIYRETVTLDRPVNLIAEPGAEIRGSDIWSEWTQTSDGWRSAQAVPAVEQRGDCEGGGEACHEAAAVYLDGRSLIRVDGRPGTGEFSLDGLRHVVLGEPPGGLVEVSARELWVHVTADDVTVDGFAMKHSLVPAQAGGITVGGYGASPVDRVTIRRCQLSDAHGALISIQGGSDQQVLDNVLTRAGQLGLHLSGEEGSSRWRVAGNHIIENRTAPFDVGWEAGGLKALRVEGLTIEGNEFAGGPAGDNGRGAWTDTGTRDVVFRSNVMHDNGYEGAFFESSHGLEVDGNVAWSNGWAGPEWAWGGGIVLSSSDHADVHDNVVAWNADGITVVSQQRTDDEDHVDIDIHDNDILMVDRPGDRAAFALGWVQDWSGPLLSPASGNQGTGNRFWYPEPEGQSTRFAWGIGLARLAEFAATPGGRDSSYLSTADAMAVIARSGLPLAPEPLPAPLPWALVSLSALITALGSLAIGLTITFGGRHSDRRWWWLPIGLILCLASIAFGLGPLDLGGPSAVSLGVAWLIAALAGTAELVAGFGTLARRGPAMPD